MSNADLPLRPERLPLVAEVNVRRRFDNRYSVTLLDLSVEGCRVELVERAAVGDLLWISLPGLETIEAAACWTDGFITGVRFKRPLHPSVFDLLAERMRGPD